MATKKGALVISDSLDLAVKNFNVIRRQLNSRYEDILEDLEYTLHCIKNKEVNIKKGGSKVETDVSVAGDNESSGSQKKKRGRPPNQQDLNANNTSVDDASATSRGQRAAAQAAGQKLAQVNSFMKATKLRRPTDFDESQSIRSSALSIPSKTRKTRRKQSAGSSHSQDTDEKDDHEVVTEDDRVLACNGDQKTDASVSYECSVKLQQLTMSVVKKTLRKNGSQETLSQKRKSSDMFSDGETPEEMDKPVKDHHVIQNETNEVPVTKKAKKSCRKTQKKKVKDIELAKSNEELLHLDDTDSQSSSIGKSPQLLTEDTLFKGFDLSDIKQNILRSNTFVKEARSDSETVTIKSKELRQQVFTRTAHSDNELTEIEVNIKDTKTNVLRKKSTQGKKKSNKNGSNEEICDNVNDIKIEDEHDSKHQPNMNGVENVARKSQKPVVLSSDSESGSPESNLRSRTKVIKKNTVTEGPEDVCRTRTKTLRKAPQTDDKTKCLSPKSKENVSNEQHNQLVKDTTIPNKGDLVKKRIEDFEKLTSEVGKTDDVPERITRQSARNKIAPSSDTQSSRPKRNARVVPQSSERAKMTPLGSQNRMTPALDSRLIVVNKGLSSATRTTPKENNSAFIQKQALEEMEKKRKEDEILKRQAKEETAKNKKQKTLKATAEETRRKREEKLKKVAAAREAAEKEKQMLALKAEKEKEEKMQQIAAEKEKQKEEQLKKKQLVHQKALEHEERRKQEEAARLAKIREQEEEYKRILAIKERDAELQKQQKAAEQRLAEAEKAKYLQHGGKLGKLAAANNANVKLQQVQTPAPQPSDCYEITPAREDRPLLEPKTENDYGIDDANSGDSSDEESKPKKKVPLWAQSENRRRLLLVNSLLPKKIWPLFMERNANPDLNRIFAGSRHPIKKRTRTSSAVWNTPPRFSSYMAL